MADIRLMITWPRIIESVEAPPARDESCLTTELLEVIATSTALIALPG